MHHVVGHSKLRILVVDDNRSIHDDFHKILDFDDHSPTLSDAVESFLGEPSSPTTRITYDIDDAYQGQEALDLVVRSIEQGRRYDVAFVDMRMPPGWDGMETVEQLWMVDPSLQIVLCTAYSDHSWQKILARLGRNDRWLVLKKPFDTIEVEQMTAALSEKRRLTNEREQYTQHLEAHVRQQTSEIRIAHEETIQRLVSASMYRDKETGEHIVRVGLMSAVLARAAGWKAADVECIRMAAMMHDVGKIGTPDSILQKPSTLTADERKIIEMHTVIGARLLSRSHSPMLQMAHDIALYHHERWNGHGYPTGLSKNDIPEAARIVAVVDVFDALTHDRVYRPALTSHAAIEILQQESGKHFDPEVIALFMANLPEIDAVLRQYPDSLSSYDLPTGIEGGEECSELLIEHAVCS